MKRIVVKFGGSNLKTEKDIAKLLKVIKSYDVPIVIVLSALYGVTNTLVDAMNRALDNEANISQFCTRLIVMHQQYIGRHIENQENQQKIMDTIICRVEKLKRHLLGIHYLGEIPDFTRDIILSYGERLSTLVLTEILKDRQINCQEVLPEDIGLITDGEFGNASINYALSSQNLQKSLTEEKIYIIPGFYGISEDRKVTLLGRGGSDYSAAAIAYCLDAESLDIWKDVNGFMSADPKVIDNPHIIHTLSYREAAELSYFGAKILHPRTFEPVMEKNIPIRIYNINEFSEPPLPITQIENIHDISPNVIKSVTSSDDLAVLKLRGPGVGIKPGIMAAVTSHLSNARINIKSIITAQTSINILLSKNDLEKSFNIVKSIGLSTVDQLIKMDNISLIAAVGEGMTEKPGIAARIFGAVSRQNINVQLISLGASAVATYFIIDQKDRDNSIKAIHEEFFSKK
jgi:aspartate kinase/aspartokinase/homoserine dehydrogenase 1